MEVAVITSSARIKLMIEGPEKRGRSSGEKRAAVLAATSPCSELTTVHPGASWLMLHSSLMSELYAVRMRFGRLVGARGKLHLGGEVRKWMYSTEYTDLLATEHHTITLFLRSSSNS